MKLFTTAFRMVGKQVWGPLAAGKNNLALKLDGPSGEPLANGLYYAVVETSSGRWVLRLLVLR